VRLSKKHELSCSARRSISYFIERETLRYAQGDKFFGQPLDLDLFEREWRSCPFGQVFALEETGGILERDRLQAVSNSIEYFLAKFVF
jgi:hypothetical protein